MRFLALIEATPLPESTVTPPEHALNLSGLIHLLINQHNFEWIEKHPLDGRGYYLFLNEVTVVPAGEDAVRHPDAALPEVQSV